MRSDIAHQHAESPEKKTQFIREVADVLRKNVVQGQKLESDAKGAVYRMSLLLVFLISLWHALGLRMNEFTELGDNSTIKNPPPLESARRARRRSKAGEASAYVKFQFTCVQATLKQDNRCCSSWGFFITLGIASSKELLRTKKGTPAACYPWASRVRYRRDFCPWYSISPTGYIIIVHLFVLDVALGSGPVRSYHIFPII